MSKDRDFHAEGQKNGATGPIKNVYSDFTKFTTTSPVIKKEMNKNETIFKAGYYHAKSQKRS
jgi:hypothetical protein